MLKKLQLFSLFILYFACFSAWGFTYVNVNKWEPNPNDDYHNDFVLLKVWKTHPGGADMNGICSDYRNYTAVEMDIFYGRPIDVKIPATQGSDNRYCFEIYYAHTATGFDFYSTLIEDAPDCYVEVNTDRSGQRQCGAGLCTEPAHLRATPACKYTGPCMDEKAYNDNGRADADINSPEYKSFAENCLPLKTYP